MTKLRLAIKNDLPALKTMFADIVAEMRKNGIAIWNEVYPYEEFTDDIAKGNLYVLTANDGGIEAAFSLFDDTSGQACIDWQNKDAKALTLTRLGVHTAHQRQGLGALALQHAETIARQQGAQFLRIFVSNANPPALRLYQKHGYTQAAGTYTEFSPSLNKDIVEYGFERPLI